MTDPSEDPAARIAALERKLDLVRTVARDLRARQTDHFALHVAGRLEAIVGQGDPPKPEG